MATYAEIIKKCEKEWACPDLMESVNKTSGRKIPFSSPSLNYITYGGIPRNAVTEFYGFEGGGKSTTAIDICKGAIGLFYEEYTKDIQELQEKVANGKKEYKAQLSDLQDRGAKKVLYLDIEHAFDRKWASTLGITYQAIEVMQTPNIAAELVLQKVLELIESGEIGLLVLDSVPSLVPQTELDKKLGERTVAPLAGLMTRFLRMVIPLLTRYDCTLLLINQQRVNMNNPYADQVPGGTAIAFYSSLILNFKHGNPVDFLGNELPQKAENPAGYKIVVTVKKQKTAPFDRKMGEYYLMAQSGLRIDFEFANLAITRYEIIRKNAGWFTICDPDTMEPLEVDGSIVKINGLAKVYDYLQSNTEYYEKLCNFIINDINHNGLTIEETEADGE